MASSVEWTTFPGQTEMAARMRAMDWTTTILGPPAQWPEPLKHAVKLCLTSRFPIALWWGPQLTMLYNDPYIPLLGEPKHPHALGRPGREAWSDIWDTIGPMLDHVMSTGEAIGSNESLFFFARNLPKEEVYVTFTYGPILLDSGRAGGVFCPCTEVTARFVAERRLRTLRDLGTDVRDVKTPVDACQRAAAVLERNQHDIPFAAIYLLDADGATARLAARMGATPPDDAFPISALMTSSEAKWPLAEAARSKRVIDVELSATFPGGTWPEPATSAMVLPLVANAESPPAGFLIAGVSPRRVLDGPYRDFFALAATQVAKAIAEARSFEAERRRVEALAEINRARTRFFSNISHEFRTPLTLMLGPVQNALEGAGDLIPRMRETLELVRRSGARMLKLVNTLVDFSRMEAGRLEMRSQATDVAAFTANLTTVRSDMELSDEASSAAGQTPAPVPRTEGSRILVVDDNVDMLQHMHQLLAAHYEVEVALSGELALASAHERPPDLIVSDAIMPGLDGFGLLRQLRADPVTRAIPVILLSARAGEPADGERAELEGLDATAIDYLGMPFSARELLARIATRLELARLHREAVERERRHGQEVLREVHRELAHATRLTTLGELAASLAHELGQPLAAMSAFGAACVRWLDRPEPDVQEAKKSAIRIIEEGARASEVLDRTRGFLRKTTAPKTSVDLTAAIREILSVVHSELIVHQVQLRDALVEHLPAVHGDRIQLQQVALNLILNGIDAMKEVHTRARELALESRTAELEGARGVLVRVQDSGIGFRSGEERRFFDPFYTTKAGGLGLGLPICRSIIQDHGGALWAEANSTHGATFSFFLPAPDRLSITPGSRRSREQPAPRRPSRATPHRTDRYSATH